MLHLGRYCWSCTVLYPDLAPRHHAKRFPALAYPSCSLLEWPFLQHQLCVFTFHACLLSNLNPIRLCWRSSFEPRSPRHRDHFSDSTVIRVSCVMQLLLLFLCHSLSPQLEAAATASRSGFRTWRMAKVLAGRQNQHPCSCNRSRMEHHRASGHLILQATQIARQFP